MPGQNFSLLQYQTVQSWPILHQQIKTAPLAISSAAQSNPSKLESMHVMTINCVRPGPNQRANTRNQDQAKMRLMHRVIQEGSSIILAISSTSRTSRITPSVLRQLENSRHGYTFNYLTYALSACWEHFACESFCCALIVVWLLNPDHCHLQTRIVLCCNVKECNSDPLCKTSNISMVV